MTLTDLVVVFTNLATGRTYAMDAQMSGTEVYVNASDIPCVQGQVYEVSIRKIGAIALFSPYELVGSAMVPVQDTYASVLVAFLGVVEVGDGYYTNADQWLTIP